MKDKPSNSFLEIFDRIDDKFLIETYKETEKLRRGSRRTFFHAVYTAAACIMVAAAVVLVVSSYLNRGDLVQPSSAGDASEISSESTASSADISDSESSDIETIEPLVYKTDLYTVEEPWLEFPDNYMDISPDDRTSYFYAEYQQQSVEARLTLAVKLTSEESGIETIPMRMYLFTDGQQTLIRYDKANLAYLDLEMTPDAIRDIDFSFPAGRLTNSAAVVCVFFPGDAARQSCVIRSARNLASEDLTELRYIEMGAVAFEDQPSDGHSSIMSLNTALHYNSEYADTVLERLISDNRECVSGAPVKTLPIGSAYLYAYRDISSAEFEREDYFDYSEYHLIALIDGEPAPVFDGEFSAATTFYKNGLAYLKLSSEYLSANSTIQLIALPVRTFQFNWWGITTECCLLTE